MNLRESSLLQGGRYRIEKVLGQGGFGITYSGYQTNLEAKVAIKEFFMKDLCNRDSNTSQVTVGSVGSRETVELFRQKFIKEARNIFRLKHRHIIPVIDVFEENGTAYYVMEHIGGGSLADKVRGGALPEEEAVRYTRQVADALAFVHSKRMMHLDVKPANILLSDDDSAVLIDFGLAKQYDTEGQQTSSTPVGISHGYAPIEQYKRGGVSTFSPATDIYSLGATLFKLVTGITPPEASDVNDEGLPALPSEISPAVRAAIEAAMEPKRKDRPQSIAEFLELLKDLKVSKDPNDSKDPDTPTEDLIVPEEIEITAVPNDYVNEETRIAPKVIKDHKNSNDSKAPKKSNTGKIVATIIATVVVLGAVSFGIFGSGGEHIDEQDISTSEKVDLGLSVCWAGWNVGASFPEDYGDYYAWGETTTKSNYTGSSYQYYYGDTCIDIGRNISGTQYDVARAQWGGSWRMPTKAEFQELKDRCTWSWTAYEGVPGYKVTGPNGNSIFLPAAGYRYGTEINLSRSGGFYWSGTLGEGYSYGAYYLRFGSSYNYVNNNGREYGRTVRPVCDK